MFSKTHKKACKRLKWIFILTFIFLLWFVPWVFVLRLGILVYFPYHADGESRYVRVTGPLVEKLFDTKWQPQENIPQSCKAAIIASEDTRFFEHIGIDFDAIKQAWEHNVNQSQNKDNKRRTKIVGGSTITQQLVKNAFLSRERSYIRKAREIIGALLANAILSKNDQLVWYLNIIEFGPEIYGIENAAKYYFNKTTRKLTSAECIRLATILPSPIKWGKHIKAKAPTKFLNKRYHTILARMMIMQMASNKDISQARQNPIGSKQPLPTPNISASSQTSWKAAESIPLDRDEEIPPNPLATPKPLDSLSTHSETSLQLSSETISSSSSTNNLEQEDLQKSQDKKERIE